MQDFMKCVKFREQKRSLKEERHSEEFSSLLDKVQWVLLDQVVMMATLYSGRWSYLEEPCVSTQIPGGRGLVERGIIADSAQFPTTRLLNGLPEAVEVVLYETLPLKDVLSQQTHQCQKPETWLACNERYFSLCSCPHLSLLPLLPVHLSEVQHCAVVESDDGGGLLVICTPIHLITQPGGGRGGRGEEGKGGGGEGRRGREGSEETQTQCTLDLPIYAGHIYDHIYHITAELVGLHVHRRAATKRGKEDGGTVRWEEEGGRRRGQTVR